MTGNVSSILLYSTKAASCRTSSINEVLVFLFILILIFLIGWLVGLGWFFLVLFFNFCFVWGRGFCCLGFFCWGWDWGFFVPHCEKPLSCGFFLSLVIFWAVAGKENRHELGFNKIHVYKQMLQREALCCYNCRHKVTWNIHSFFAWRQWLFLQT